MMSSNNIDDKEEFIPNTNLIAQKGMFETESPIDMENSISLKNKLDAHKMRRKGDEKKMNNLYMMNYYAICGSEDEEYYFRTQVHNKNLPQVNMAQQKFSDRPVHLDKLFKEEDDQAIE